VIRKKILDARENGYGAPHQDVKIGNCGLAVPVRRYDGRTVSALHITGTIDDPPVRRLPRLKAAVEDLQRQLF